MQDSVLKARLQCLCVPNDERAPLEDIIGLKRRYWGYLPESHREWIKENLNPDDEHICLYEGDELAAYLNMVRIVCEDGGRAFEALGIGNVCVAREGKGIGTLLMKRATDIIKARSKMGVLLCSESLVPFYKRCGLKTTDRLHIRSQDSKVLSKRIMVTDDSQITDAYFTRAF